MGYYTSYNVDVVNANYADGEDGDMIANIAIALSRKPSWIYYDAAEQEKREQYLKESGADALYELVSTDVHRWYEYESEMREISLQFPECEFVVHGNGEDPEDHWRHFFKNGQDKFCAGHILYDAAPEWSESCFDDEY